MAETAPKSHADQLRSDLERQAHSLFKIHQDVETCRAALQNIRIKIACLIALCVGITIGATGTVHVLKHHPQKQVAQGKAEIPDIPEEAFAELFGFTALPDPVLKRLETADHGDTKMKNTVTAARHIKPLLDAHAARLSAQAESALLYMTEHESEKLALWRAMPLEELYALLQKEVDPRHKEAQKAVLFGRFAGLFSIDPYLQEKGKREQKRPIPDKQPPKRPVMEETSGQLAQSN